MESLSETLWDVVIEGTGLRQSLLALALSRSDKKILHVDQHDYYGSAEAAFGLQEADEWVGNVAADSLTLPFRNASLWKAGVYGDERLSFSRAYALSLSPQIVYSTSQLLAQLVSSKVYKQLEFQAVGTWWIYDSSAIDASPSLRRIPNGREDIFEDKSIDLRAKRSLMKFLKFVVDYQSSPETWEPHATSSLPDFLSTQFKLPPHLQTVIIALALSLETPDNTTVSYSLPRIARHLTSIGVLGPGFGAVLPKWGGGAEIAQVACRAGAVGGGVYVLGTGVKDASTDADGSSDVTLSNGEVVKTKLLLRDVSSGVPSDAVIAVSRIIAVVSTSLLPLFESTIEGAPLSAVSVVVFPPNTLSTSDTANTHPIYIMAHSNETGECPGGQSVLYATTLYSSNRKALLKIAIDSLLLSTQNAADAVLYSLHYEQTAPSFGIANPLDLAFDDRMLEDVKCDWKKVVGEVDAKFMRFEDWAGMNNEQVDGDCDY
ncbi:GDP dissociation inhibitor [Calycina marina]|uniref:Rab proteins geranylgeranyltransferase n=1 Tax=Calycina marina TaxID=1763456 RepID=A0A9P7YVI0_9HELO|nr:GDP dissociation inhibitor [Calycina marina]